MHPATFPVRAFAWLMVTAVFLYLINNYLVYWQDLPGPGAVFAKEQPSTAAWAQLLGYLFVFIALVVYVRRSADISIRQDSHRFELLSAYLVRSAFWAVLLIGFVDVAISFLRVEKMLHLFFSEQTIIDLGRPSFRGTYVHYPLLLAAFVVAFFIRKISFTWLALMVVLAEFLIVVTRFIFSYEQAFMGDLVRFWYAALFLFASAYTLINEAHVRVDVLYAGFSRVKKAWSNIVGSLFLGIPVCWIILVEGMGGRGNSINSPLLSFEISQSGYGMYVKYLMAGFLVVFAVTMIIQFVSYLLHNIAQLVDPEDDASLAESTGEVCLSRTSEQ